jgi:hypothetical protein
MLTCVLAFSTSKVFGIRPITSCGQVFQLLRISTYWGNLSSSMNGNSAMNTNPSGFLKIVGILSPRLPPADLPERFPNFEGYDQVRIVDGRLVCSCKNYERVGTPCRHILHVLISADPSYPGIGHHAVSIVWHNVFYQYAYRDDYKDLARLLELARRKEVTGPAFPLARLAVIPIVTQLHDDLKLKPTESQCSNYSVESIRAACRSAGLQRQGGMSAPTAGIPATFTQESMVYADDGLAVDLPSGEDNSWEGSGTETVFTTLSNQIASVDPFIKEISSLYEGNSTQAEINECKTYLGAGQDIPEQRDCSEESRAHEAECGDRKENACRRL